MYLTTEKMKNLLPLFLLLALSCKKENPEPTPTPTAPQNYMVINGDGHSNDRVNFTAHLEGWRVDSTAHTVIGGCDSALCSSAVSVSLNSSTTGSALMLDEHQAQYCLSVAIFDGTIYKHGTGTATITKYEPVGGVIECNYSGTFKKASDTTVTVTVSGVFSVTRQSDQ